MAEIIGLDVILGMDATEMQSELQKAQNLLRQFESQLKKSTDTVEITKLNAEIAKVNATINNFSTAMSGASKPTADATNALGNLSRIAQDAPYGFMGIANNLNPMLESFQRLQKESGGAGSALKAMAAGLTGPAGIGLALGVVSSLIVKYGDEIGNLIVKTTDFEKSQEAIRTSFFDSLKSVEATIATDQALISVISDVTQSTEARKKALNELKEAHKGNVELQKTDINDGAALIEIINGLSEALIRKAKIEATAKIIGEEQAKLTRLEMSTIQEQVGNLSGLAKTWDVLSGSVKGALGGTGALGIGLNLVNDGLKNNEKQVSTTKDSIDKLKDSLKSLTGEAYKAGDFNVIGKGGKTTTDNKGEDSDLQKRITLLEKAIKLEMDLANQEMKQYEARQKFNKEDGLGIEKFEINKGDKTPKKLDKDLPDWAKEDVAISKKLDKDLKQAQKTATDFAQTLSQDITGGLMSMWEAMESGESPLAALGNFFADLLKQLAAAVVQAILFQTIMSALGFGAVAGGGGGGLIGGIGKIFGFAEGGIVSQPTLSMVGEGGQSEAIMPLNKLGNMMNSTFNAGAMSSAGAGGGNGQFVLKGNDLVLAMQRSNFSLNVRR
jgi:hypothetical protein